MCTSHAIIILSLLPPTFNIFLHLCTHTKATEWAAGAWVRDSRAIALAELYTCKDIPYSSKFLWHNIFVNFVIWLLIMKISSRKFSMLVASTGTYVCVSVTFFHSNGSWRLEVCRTCLSYEGHPDGLKASGARLEFEAARRYFDSFFFTLTSPNATCKNCGWSDNVNCQRGRRGAEVITKKRSNHEIFITKIYIYVVFSNFIKILNHENLLLYGINS